MTELLTQISDIVGPNGLIIGDHVRARPADWLGRTNCQAKAIVRPASTRELSSIMRLCHAAGQSVIGAGGLTGLVHATDATPDDILISFERMTAVESVDPVGRTLTVQCGAQLQKVQETAREHNLLFAVDLGARGSATIGGTMSTNAGGNQVVRYGMMREQVLGIEAVLADGTIISSMNRLLKNNTGYDLKQLFIGSEGTLGLITRAVLRLHPLPTSETTALVAVEDFNALTSFFRHMSSGLGGSLTAFEVMWKEHYELIAVQSGRHTTPLAPGAGYYVVVEAGGMDPERDALHFTSVLERAAEQGLITDAVIASSKAQRESIWSIREDIEGLTHALMPAAAFDVSLPIPEMKSYTESLRGAVRAKWGPEGRLIIFGHLGDNNLHIVISPRPWSDEAQHEAERLVYEPLARIGGSISAEHGIGLEKRNWLHISRTPEELALMRAIKTAMDPRNILNPGKVLERIDTITYSLHKGLLSAHSRKSLPE